MEPIIISPTEAIGFFRTYRKQHKISQKSIANCLGTVQHRICTLETAPQDTNYHLSTLVRYAAALGLDLKILLDPIEGSDPIDVPYTKFKRTQ